MQVKKFEAKTMKEALQMVKQELGPEAIILSAKDNKKTFGLAGGGSIEITAAISEKSLIKKQYVENQIPEKDRARFRTQSAKNQKTFIENTITRRQRNAPLDPRIGVGAVAQRPLTARRYIDIGDEEDTKSSQTINGRRVEDVLAEVMKAAHQMPQTGITEVKSDQGALRKEVDSLREMLSHFQNTEKTLGTRYPGADFGLPFEFSHSFEKLQEAGVDNAYIVEVLEKANRELTPVERKKKSLVDGWVARFILNNISVVENWTTAGCPLHLFFGPSGQGKTTTLVKIAAHLSLDEGKRVAVFSCDTNKVGSSEQLKTYCQILNLPFEVLRHSAEFNSILNKYDGYDAILVDYPGLGLKDIQEIDQIRALLPTSNVRRVGHLVLGCTIKDQDAYEACSRYQATDFDDIIISKVDESSIHGVIYNLQKKIKKPLYAFGIGPQIPEDIELATRERVLDLIFKITKR